VQLDLSVQKKKKKKNPEGEEGKADLRSVGRVLPGKGYKKISRALMEGDPRTPAEAAILSYSQKKAGKKTQKLRVQPKNDRYRRGLK